jgi:hypothetical protein
MFERKTQFTHPGIMARRVGRYPTGSGRTEWRSGHGCTSVAVGGLPG